MQLGSILTFESQCCALNVDIIQCLIMILEMFPETGTVEIICPVKKGQSSSRKNKIRVDNPVTGTSLRKGRVGGWVGGARS